MALNDDQISAKSLWLELQKGRVADDFFRENEEKNGDAMGMEIITISTSPSIHGFSLLTFLVTHGQP